jgi:DNA-binding MarR family transcriptional regulator
MKKIDHSYEFRILDEVSKDGDLTQRSLSQRLGVALGLTNLYVKRLVKKGFIKVVNIKPNRLRYELTPSGIAQKTSLAFQYIKDSYIFYQEVRKNLTRLFVTLKDSGVKSVSIYGTGDIVEIALLSLQETNLELTGIVSKRYAGLALCGKPIHPPEMLLTLNYDRIVVVEQERDEVMEVLGKLGVDASTITWIGEPNTRP